MCKNHRYIKIIRILLGRQLFISNEQLYLQGSLRFFKRRMTVKVVFEFERGEIRRRRSSSVIAEVPEGFFVEFLGAKQSFLGE